MTFNEIYITYKCKKRVFYRIGQIKDALDKIQFFFISSGMTISPSVFSNSLIHFLIR